MDQPPVDQERLARVRQARQVLVGSEIQPPPSDSLGLGGRFAGGVRSLEVRYFIGLAILVLLAAIVWAAWGMTPATPILFLLAVGLLLAWFIL